MSRDIYVFHDFLLLRLSSHHRIANKKNIMNCDVPALKPYLIVFKENKQNNTVYLKTACMSNFLSISLWSLCALTHTQKVHKYIIC